MRGELQALMAAIRDEGLQIDLRPELAGKPSQAGSLDEMLESGVHPCVDFAHQHARTGRFHSYGEFAAMLDAIRTRLGPGALRRMHIHVSGIECGPRGERRHLPLRQSDFAYRALLRALRDFRVEGWLVTESPRMEEDAVFLQRAWRRL